MDFAQRYAKELSQLSTPLLVDQKLADDKVLFRLGSFDDLLHLPDTLSLNITQGEGYFEMTWLRADTAFLCMAFPAQNTLIMGCSQRELTERLPAEIQEMPKGIKKPDAPKNLEAMGTKFWTTTGESYYLNSLTDALYYEKSDDAFVPVFSDSQRALSVANLFHGLIDRDYRFHIELSLFDFSTKRFLTSLSQWINFCQSRNFHVYCGIEEEREDGLKVLLIAENRELKYNHMLSIIVPDRFVSDNNVVLKARLNSYIPTHNVRELFKQYTEKKQKRFHL